MTSIAPLTKKGLEDYMYSGVRPGDFLMALLTNNLKQTILLADDYNQEHIKDLVKYLYWEMPSACQGSVEKVETWLKKFEKDE